MMFYQKIADGISMPMLGFGTFMNTGADCERTVAEAIHTGYRLIDTAEAYGNEEQVGREIKAGMENSLRLLGTDYLDLVLLHWPFADYYTAWRELEKLHKAGYICVSAPPEQCRGYAAEHDAGSKYHRHNNRLSQHEPICLCVYLLLAGF